MTASDGGLTVYFVGTTVCVHPACPDVDLLEILTHFREQSPDEDGPLVNH